MNIKHIADTLVRKHRTRDPFRIAKEMGFIIIRTPMKGIRGFYQHVRRCCVIYIDSALDYHDARFVCAHEMGHALMHRGLNRIYMDSHTYFPTKRYEIDADRFAVDLLYDDEDLRDFLDQPVQVAADCMGVSPELAAYRLKNISWSRLPG